MATPPPQPPSGRSRIPLRKIRQYYFIDVKTIIFFVIISFSEVSILATRCSNIRGPALGTVRTQHTRNPTLLPLANPQPHRVHSHLSQGTMVRYSRRPLPTELPLPHHAIRADPRAAPFSMFRHNARLRKRRPSSPPVFGGEERRLLPPPSIFGGAEWDAPACWRAAGPRPPTPPEGTLSIYGGAERGAPAAGTVVRAGWPARARAGHRAWPRLSARPCTPLAVTAPRFPPVCAPLSVELFHFLTDKSV